jgi:hypothetical protein
LKDQEGPVKEHLLEEVYQKRQRTREAPQSAEAPEADQLDDRTNRFEGQFNASAASLSWSGDAEDEKLQELDGEQLSEFNMDREREEGFDLETLEMTRGKGEEEELAKDPWLASLQQEHVRFVMVVIFQHWYLVCLCSGRIMCLVLTIFCSVLSMCFPALHSRCVAGLCVTQSFYSKGQNVAAPADTVPVKNSTHNYNDCTRCTVQKELW